MMTLLCSKISTNSTSSSASIPRSFKPKRHTMLLTIDKLQKNVTTINQDFLNIQAGFQKDISDITFKEFTFTYGSDYSQPLTLIRLNWALNVVLFHIDDSLYHRGGHRLVIITTILNYLIFDNLVKVETSISVLGEEEFTTVVIKPGHHLTNLYAR